MNEQTKQAQLNYEIVSDMICDFMKKDNQYKILYVEYYNNDFLKYVDVIYIKMDTKKFIDILKEAFYRVRHYKDMRITIIETEYTKTIKIR